MGIDPKPDEDVRIRTLADLARLAGVTAGTVSRALAGKSLVNPETRDRIERLAAEHKFRPNQMARRLRTRRTGIIGVVVPLGHERRQHLSDPFFMKMLGHLADVLTEDGYDLMLSRVIPDARDWLERITTSGMLDGVLIIGQSDQHDAIEQVARDYLPVVAWGSNLPGQVHCAIGTDNFAGGSLAGEHLVARGARRVAFIGEMRTPEIRQRCEGVAAAMHAAGYAPPLRLEAHLASDVMEEEIERHLDRIAAERIDGIAAASDMLASTTLRVLAARGISVPDDIRVIGYDDLPFAATTSPALTTIRQDIAMGAQTMVTALFARIAGDPAPSVEMAPALIARQST